MNSSNNLSRTPAQTDFQPILTIPSSCPTRQIESKEPSRGLTNNSGRHVSMEGYANLQASAASNSLPRNQAPQVWPGSFMPAATPANSSSHPIMFSGTPTFPIGAPATPMQLAFGAANGLQLQQGQFQQWEPNLYNHAPAVKTSFEDASSASMEFSSRQGKEVSRQPKNNSTFSAIVGGKMDKFPISESEPGEYHPVVTSQSLRAIRLTQADSESPEQTGKAQLESYTPKAQLSRKHVTEQQDFQRVMHTEELSIHDWSWSQHECWEDMIHRQRKELLKLLRTKHNTSENKVGRHDTILRNTDQTSFATEKRDTNTSETIDSVSIKAEIEKQTTISLAREDSEDVELSAPPKIATPNSHSSLPRELNAGSQLHKQVAYSTIDLNERLGALRKYHLEQLEELKKSIGVNKKKKKLWKPQQKLQWNQEIAQQIAEMQSLKLALEEPKEKITLTTMSTKPAEASKSQFVLSGGIPTFTLKPEMKSVIEMTKKHNREQTKYSKTFGLTNIKRRLWSDAENTQWAILLDRQKREMETLKLQLCQSSGHQLDAKVTHTQNSTKTSLYDMVSENGNLGVPNKFAPDETQSEFDFDSEPGTELKLANKSRPMGIFSSTIRNNSGSVVRKNTEEERIQKESELSVAENTKDRTLEVEGSESGHSTEGTSDGDRSEEEDAKKALLRPGKEISRAGRRAEIDWYGKLANHTRATSLANHKAQDPRSESLQWVQFGEQNAWKQLHGYPAKSHPSEPEWKELLARQNEATKLLNIQILKDNQSSTNARSSHSTLDFHTLLAPQSIMNLGKLENTKIEKRENGDCSIDIKAEDGDCLPMKILGKRTLSSSASQSTRPSKITRGEHSKSSRASPNSAKMKSENIYEKDKWTDADLYSA